MTTITMTCATCGRELAIPERYRGRELKCPSCGHPFRAATVEVPHEPDPAPKLEPASLPGPVASPAVRAKPYPPTPLPPMAEPFGDALDASPEPEAPEAAGSEPVYWRVKRVGVLSAGLMSAAIYAAVGLLVGVAVALVSFIPAAALASLCGPFVGALAIVVLPVAYGLIGFVAGVVVAFVYNLAARFLGGLRVLLD